MADNLPGYNPDALSWLEGRIAGWVADPTAIGLTSAVATSLATDIINARTDFTSVQTIRGESKNATTTFRGSGDLMRANAAKAIISIKAYAKNAAVPQTVYDAANISAPDPRGPVAPPEQPTDLEAVLQNNGSILVSWSGKGPSGTLYELYRKLAGETSWTFMANVDALTKEFSDAGVPAGTVSASYQVRALRGDQASPYSTLFSIVFGNTEGQGEEAAA